MPSVYPAAVGGATARYRPATAAPSAILSDVPEGLAARAVRQRRGHRVRRPRHARWSEVHEVTVMPRPIQELLDHADELARRFEDDDPDPRDEVAVADVLLRRAALARARSERAT